MKKQLFITFTLLGMSISGYTQTIFSSNSSMSTYFICPDNIPMSYKYNQSRQLGDGTIISRSTPKQVSGMFDVIKIAAGSNHSLFLKNDGSVWSTGRNDDGQLGDGTNVNKLTPTLVVGLSDIIDIAAGTSSSLFLKNDGNVWVTGYVIDGNIPIQLSGISGVIAMAVSWDHFIFLKNDGTVWTSGGNHYGQLGVGTTTYVPYHMPVKVIGISGVTKIAAGQYHSLFLKNDGSVWGCGDNHTGQMGDGTSGYNNKKLTAVQINGISDIVDITAGLGSSLFLNNQGEVWGCGYTGAILGSGTYADSYIPVQAIGLSEIVEIEAGTNHSHFIKNDGSVFSSGVNEFGQLGGPVGPNTNIPIQVPVNTKCLELSIDDEDNYFSGMSLYPNPASNIIVLQNTVGNKINQNSTVKIINSTGQILQTTNESYWLDNQIILDISNLSSGIYFIQFIDGINERHIKFVKE